MRANINLTCPVVSTEDETDFRKVIGHAIAQGYGANIIFILGTTGEFYKLTIADKKGLVGIAVDELAKQKIGLRKTDLPLELAVGVTGNNLDETIELAQYAEQKGADYAVLMPGYITRDSDGRFTRRGITKNVKTVIETTPKIRFILYTHPGMTGGKDMRTATWKKLARNPRIDALKASACNEKRIRNYQEAADGNAKVYIGDEILGLKIPSDGIVAGSSNVLPVAWSIASRRDPYEDIQEGLLADRLTEFQKEYAENPIGAFKYMLAKLGIISSETTLDPNLKVSVGLKSRLDKLMLRKDFKIDYSLDI